ncbi:MAG: sugar ABC transporter permease [Maritimibacter sp.]|jgi:multiple sugar transport system permease protein
MSLRDDAKPWIGSNLTLVLLGALPALLLVGALIYFTIWVLTFSFTDLTLVGPKSVNWHWVGFDNFERLFTRRGFLGSLWTTIVFTFTSAVLGQSVLGFALAAVMRTIRSRLRTALEVAIMLGWLLPDIVAAFLWSATTAEAGLINRLIIAPLGFEPINFINDFAFQVVIVANVWKGTAWSYLLFSAALDAVPREVVEAAKVDGATAMQRIRRVILPMIRSHIATNTLFITIWTFTYFPLIYALTGGGPGRRTEVLAIFMYKQSFGIGKLGYGSAISVAMLLIVGLLAVFYMRLLKEPE